MDRAPDFVDDAAVFVVFSCAEDRRRGRRSSRLDLVEGFSRSSRRSGSSGACTAARELIEAIEDYIETRNEEPRPFIGTKSADEIFASIARYCQRTSDSGHQAFCNFKGART